MNANTLEDSVDQYDSMVKEKAIADPNRRDPRWLNVFPSSEMTPWRRQWPVLPTFTYGGHELRHDHEAGERQRRRRLHRCAAYR